MAIRDVVTFGFGSWGTVPYVTRLGFGGNATALVGTWQRVTFLEARDQTVTLESRSDRLTLEARDGDME